MQCVKTNFSELRDRNHFLDLDTFSTMICSLTQLRGARPARVTSAPAPSSVRRWRRTQRRQRCCCSSVVEKTTLRFSLINRLPQKTKSEDEFLRIRSNLALRVVQPPSLQFLPRRETLPARQKVKTNSSGSVQIWREPPAGSAPTRRDSESFPGRTTSFSFFGEGCPCP